MFALFLLCALGLIRNWHSSLLPGLGRPKGLFMIVLNFFLILFIFTFGHPLMMQFDVTEIQISAIAIFASTGLLGQHIWSTPVFGFPIRY